MRHFDYINGKYDTWSIKEYISTLRVHVSLLIKRYGFYEEYCNLYKALSEFTVKYPNIDMVMDRIVSDFNSVTSTLYFYRKGVYSPNSSLLGKELERDINNIFNLEDKAKDRSVSLSKGELTPYDSIENGKPFRVVGHCTSSLEFKDYLGLSNKELLLSCLILSNRELNTFYNERIVYVMDYDSDSYLFSSKEDCSSKLTDQYILPFYNFYFEYKGSRRVLRASLNEKDRMVVTSVLTPELLEYLSSKREHEGSYNLFNSLTNEVVFKQSGLRIEGVLLVGNEYDFLLDEYFMLCKMGLSFKCINRGLYGCKCNREQYEVFSKLLNDRDHIYSMYLENPSILDGYYRDVVLRMGYSDDIKVMIKSKLDYYSREFKELKVKRLSN